MWSSRAGFVTVVCVAVVVWSVPVGAQTDEPFEVYSFNTLAVGGDGDDSYVDMFAGSDMLPYTDDDFAVPERGNVGGTWGFAHHDLNSDGVVDEDEHVFDVIRRDDDDTFGFTVMSRPEYGVIYEAEDWIDYHEARNEGPSATLIGDLGAEGADFEHNDHRPWCSESNAYFYNHAQEDQHGKGKPRYYFEHINPGSEPAAGEDWVYDEVEGFQKPLNFQHNLDDPTTGFDERGECRRDYFRTFDAVTRGYLIPVEDLPDLEDGSLPTLFGWEGDLDLAAYLRDVIEPKLWDDANPGQPNPDMSLYHGAVGTQAANLPITHLMLMQIEVPIEVNIGDTCGSGQAAAQAMADYWGIPPTGATYRVSHILGFNANLVEAFLGAGLVRDWVHEPADGVVRNLWLEERFFRDDPGVLGSWQITPQGASWVIEPDPQFGIVENTNNKIIRTSGGGMIRAPLPRALGEGELPLEVLVEVAKDSEETELQVVLAGGGQVKAYAEFAPDRAALRLGGEGLQDGWATGGEGVEGEEEPIIGDLADSQFSRYVLRVAPDRLSLLEAPFDGFDPSDWTELNDDEMVELVGMDVENGGGLAPVDTVGVAAVGPAAVDAVAVFAAPPGSFVPSEGGLQRPSDCNQDGNLDISDGICLLGHLFLGDPAELPCGDGSTTAPGNVSLLDNDGNGDIQLTDAINLFNFLFIGGPPVAGCVDPLCEECIEIPGCPDACP